MVFPACLPRGNGTPPDGSYFRQGLGPLAIALPRPLIASVVAFISVMASAISALVGGGEGLSKKALTAAITRAVELERAYRARDASVKQQLDLGRAYRPARLQKKSLPKGRCFPRAGYHNS
jgi:hypothetical protein